MPKVQGTLSTYENPKPSFAKTDLALPYLTHDIRELRPIWRFTDKGLDELSLVQSLSQDVEGLVYIVKNYQT